MRSIMAILLLLWVGAALAEAQEPEVIAGKAVPLDGDTLLVAETLSRYSCKVENIHGEDALGMLWANARLTYDADAGVLDGSFDPDGELAKAGIQLPPGRLFSRLKVETGPWEQNNLTAVQYDPADPPNVRPIVAWIMIETLEDPNFPRFQFFSNTIRVLITGKCVRG